MVNTVTRKGVSQPQNGIIAGIVQVTTESTTYSINVSTVSGYSNVTSILYAVASPNVGAAVSTSISAPVCQWTTTDAIIKITCDASQSTATIAVRFDGQ